MTLSQRDRQLIWHPFTQEKTSSLPIAMTRGKGVYLFDEDGNKYLDLISSWWVNLHGHSHPKIAKAIYEQAKTLEHVIFAGCTHEPAVKLCENLKDILPKKLSRFFFSDNGSTSVEVAIKMAYQYWWNKGEKKRKTFLSFEGGYHGDTFGAMSLGSQSGFHTPFKELLFKVHGVPFPETYNDDPNVHKKEAYSLEHMKKYLNKHGHTVAAFIVEPLLQGAAGMRVCRPQFLREVIRLLKKYNIIIIFDEVMTGFYRTGKPFALEKINYTPDILCLSKGLTGGFLPLALTVSSEQIFKAFLGEHFSQALAHGHSYTANPLGCAAGIASLKLLKDDATKTKIKSISKLHKNFLNSLMDTYPKLIKAPRSLGTMAAFNLFKETNDYNFKQTAILKKKFLEKNLLIRPLGNTIYLLPPYCITEKQLQRTYDTILNVLKDI